MSDMWVVLLTLDFECGDETVECIFRGPHEVCDLFVNALDGIVTDDPRPFKAGALVIPEKEWKEFTAHHLH